MPIQKFSVSRDDTIYEAWPDLAMTKSGKLVCTIMECKHHGNRENARIAIKYSTDRGRTWSEKVFLTEKTSAEEYWNNARISCLKDGRLCILCDKIKKDENKNQNTVYMWFSEDEGLTWSDAIKTSINGFCPDKLYELSSGNWIITAQYYNNQIKKLEQFCWISENKGKSWSEKILVAADNRYNLCEGSLLELKNGTLVIFMRENSGMGYDCMKSFSYDGGKNWEGVYNMPIPGAHHPVSGFLNSGKIMIAYRFMQGGKGWLGTWTQNFFIAVSDELSVIEKERKKQWARIMPVDFDRSPVSDLGYSGFVQFDDGEIYVVNYIVDDAPNAQIRGYSFYENDIIIE